MEHQPLDEETAAALTLFNTYLVADREQQAHDKAVRAAEKAKSEAAAAVRRLNERKAPAAEASAAEARYREAVDTLQQLRDGRAPASRRERGGAGGRGKDRHKDNSDNTGKDAA